MTGKILDYIIQTSSGIISSDDGNRYSFVSSEWKSSDFPLVNQIVDFEIDGQSAKAIYGTKVEKVNETKGLIMLAFGIILLGVSFYLGYLAILDTLDIFKIMDMGMSRWANLDNGFAKLIFATIAEAIGAFMCFGIGSSILKESKL